MEATLEQTSASLDIPEDSDLHIALLPKNQVEEVVDLSEATKVEFSLKKESP